MSVLHRHRNASADPAATAQPQELAGPAELSRGGRGPGSRTSVAWRAICVTAVTLVVLVVFVLQNTHGVEITFLWMHGNVPLASALLVAAVGAARIALPRRQNRRHRNASAILKPGHPEHPSGV
jgi:uncharacterized integral membrane protein